MKEKEKIIIDSAIKLFAAKGYSATSISEIVVESGISKGAFYLYFKSKDALLLSIFEQYSDQLNQQMTFLENQELPPREKFIKQLMAVLESVIQNKALVVMQIREQAIPLNEEIKEKLFNMQLEMHHFLQQGLLNVYGDSLKPFSWDLSLMLEGMIHSYLRILFFKNETIHANLVVSFMMRRMDDIISGLATEKPLVNEQFMNELISHKQNCMKTDLDDVLMEMKNIILELDHHEELMISFEVLEQEIQKEKPRVPVIQGMLSNFSHIAELQACHYKIIAFYHLQ